LLSKVLFSVQTSQCPGAWGNEGNRYSG